MRKAKGIFSAIVFLLSVAFVVSVFAQVPASQTAGGITRQRQELEKERALEEKITTEKAAPKEGPPEELIPEDAGPKVLITSIKVEGAQLLSEKEIQAIISPFEGKELSLTAMQKVADLITDAYRSKGYVTSRAYIPPQTVKEGILIIRVVEGRLGELDIKGNRYFSTELLRKKFDIKPTGYFDYSAFQQSLVYINEHPDRMARAVLMPGKEPGTTDIIIEVEDRLPIHPGIAYDNYASRYLSHDRYSVFLEHNNLLGFDDKLYLKYQMSESDYLKLEQVQYTFPLNNTIEVGAYYLGSDTELGEEFKALDAEGEADLFGVFLDAILINKPDLDVRLTFGFDYKDIENYLLGVKTSEDNVRVAKVGFDVDTIDSWGRTIFTSGLDIGIPDIMGGMDSKDPMASRTGAGGKFYKGIFNLFRLQPMPWETTLLWKNTFQYTNYNLVASEQFQIGGATSVRGYPPAEYAGDKGLYTALELSMPVYPVSKDAYVPFTTDVKLYDALRFVTFYDWGTTHINSIIAGEKKHQTLRSVGCGVRLNVKDNLSFRVELGWPVGGRTPSDGDHMHPWFELIWKI